MRVLRAFVRATRGAAAVEFALVCSVLFATLIGIFNVGWAFYCGADVRHGIERASRLYIADPNTTDAQFRSRVGDYLEVTRLADIGTTVTRTTLASGAPIVRITWTYDYMLVVPFMTGGALNFGSQIVVPIGA